MLSGFLRALWGDLSIQEVKKIILLSCIITLILGSYWILKVLKNPIFNELVGMKFQPYAKIISIFIVALVILIYSKLVDLFDKKTLFDIICGFYSALFFLTCFATKNSEYFSMDSSSKFYHLVVWIPGKIIGWISYFAFESSSLLMILFWAFVVSITKPEFAKKGYAIIVTCAQIGTILGTAIVTYGVKIIGSYLLIGLCGFLVLLVPFLIRLYMLIITKKELAYISADDNKSKTSFFEGLKLIVTRPYVIGILIISTIYEIIGTVLEFQMNMIATEVFISRDLFVAFSGKYGMSINSVVLLFSLLGTNFFMRRFGLKFCLIFYPASVGAVLLGLLGVNFIEVTKTQIMWVLFVTAVVVKGLGYALNNPTKEVMYIPTTKDIRFKAKGWIESFGSRCSKGSGSIITAAFTKNLSDLLIFGTLISLGIVCVWITVATLLGNKFNKLQKENAIIG